MTARLPAEPLYRAVGAESMKTTARALNVNIRQLYRWNAYGIDQWRADRLAIGLGLHPAEVWPDWGQP